MSEVTRESLAPNITRWNDEDGWRIYEVDKKKYLSVTGILQFFVDQKLKSYYVRNSAASIAKTLETTSKAGTALHTKAGEGQEDRFNKLLKEMEAEVLDREFVVKSKHGWAGQCDLKVKWKGKKYIWDIKSGNFGHVALQLGAYSLAANEMGHGIEGIGCISLPRDLTKDAKYFDYTDYPGAPTMEENQYAWCASMDSFKRNYYKKLQEYPWYPIKTVLEYNWSYNWEK